MLAPSQQRVLDAAIAITGEQPERTAFLHALLCQVGLPRSRTDARTFVRRSGHASVMVEAGKLFDGQNFIDLPLPYGAIPRLVMVHVSSEAVRTRNRTVAVRASMRQFMNALGIQLSGGERGGYTAFKRQMEALAACRITLGMNRDGLAITKDAKPFSGYDAWFRTDGNQRSLWPGVLELSHEFYDTLCEHAVPLDPRALASLKHSALALDIYCWLAHRLCRVAKASGCRLSWQNIREQFGQEYRDGKNFKREFRNALHQATAVYPQARFAEVPGGFVLFPSQPPLRRLS